MNTTTNTAANTADALRTAQMEARRLGDLYAADGASREDYLAAEAVAEDARVAHDRAQAEAAAERVARAAADDAHRQAVAKATEEAERVRREAPIRKHRDELRKVLATSARTDADTLVLVAASLAILEVEERTKGNLHIQTVAAAEIVPLAKKLAEPIEDIDRAHAPSTSRHVEDVVRVVAASRSWGQVVAHFEALLPFNAYAPAKLTAPARAALRKIVAFVAEAGGNDLRPRAPSSGEKVELDRLRDHERRLDVAEGEARARLVAANLANGLREALTAPHREAHAAARQKLEAAQRATAAFIRDLEAKNVDLSMGETDR